MDSPYRNENIVIWHCMRTSTLYSIPSLLFSVLLQRHISDVRGLIQKLGDTIQTQSLQIQHIYFERPTFKRSVVEL